MVGVPTKKRADGFTIIELVTVITVIGILAGIGFGLVQAYQYAGRDNERISDAESIARAFEISYLRDTTANGPTYPDTTTATTTSSYSTLLKGQDLEMTKAPGRTTGTSIVAAASTTQPQSPTKDQYIYLPLTSTGALCTSSSSNLCVRFLLYYSLEDGNVVKAIESIHQQ